MNKENLGSGFRRITGYLQSKRIDGQRILEGTSKVIEIGATSLALTGCSIGEIGYGIGGGFLAILGGYGFLKSIKIIRPGYEGQKVRLGRPVGPGHREGLMFRIPFLDRVIEVDRRPVIVGTPEAISAYVQDGSQIDIDVRAILSPGRAADVVRLAPVRPVVGLGDAVQIVAIAGQEADTASRQVIASLKTALDIANPNVIQALQDQVRLRVQEALDITVGNSIPEVGQLLIRAQQQGIPRANLPVGIRVTDVVIQSLIPGREVTEAMQGQAGASYRLKAEGMALRTLGDNYGIDRQARAAEVAAREGKDGTTVVIGMGGQQETAAMGTLGGIGRLTRQNSKGSTRDVLDKASKVLGMSSLRNSTRE